MQRQPGHGNAHRDGRFAGVQVGTVVRDQKWGGRFTGTVTRRDEDHVFVAWHGSLVEDELHVAEVDVWSDAPSELTTWRGGVGILDREESLRILPVP